MGACSDVEMVCSMGDECDGFNMAAGGALFTNTLYVTFSCCGVATFPVTSLKSSVFFNVERRCARSLVRGVLQRGSVLQPSDDVAADVTDDDLMGLLAQADSSSGCADSGSILTTNTPDELYISIS